MKTTKNTYDIIIVGGGLAGLSLACLLGRHTTNGGLKIACIDQADPKEKPADRRTTAISYGSRKILEKAGICENITQSCAIKDIQILDGTSPILLEFLSEDVQGKSFGWIVDNHDLKAAMMKRLKTLKNIHHIAPAKVTNFKVTTDNATIILDNKDEYEASLIIGADGRNSAVRAHMEQAYNLQTRQWNYHQRAIICTVQHQHPHNNVAVEHFWPEGPFAILPAADHNKKHRSSVVFTEHGPEKTSLMNFTDEEFTIALAARFPENYGDVQLIGKRISYPLGLVHAENYIAPHDNPRMVLVADAAHGIHPIAGQGLNLGFRDLNALDTLIAEALTNDTNLTDSKHLTPILQTYQRQRRPDNMAMVAMTDGLNRLFSNNITPVRILRKTGLKFVSRLRPAKKFFMKQAMGDKQ